jgi:hypothetical protein
MKRGADCIAKTRPEKTIVYRVELQQKERELLESAIQAYNFNKVTTPIVAGLSDVSFMIVLGGLLTLFFPEIILPTGEAKMGDVMDAINRGIEQGRERAEAERDATGEATLDDATGVRDLIGRIWYNLTNPNWTINPNR